MERIWSDVIAPKLEQRHIAIGALLAIGAIGAMQLKNDDCLSDESFLKFMIEWYKRLPLLRGKR